MTTFATPSPAHERTPKRQRYCTSCRRDVEVALADDLCPVCHEKSLLPLSDEQRRDRKTV